MADTPNKGIHDPRIRKAGYIVLAAALGVLTVFDVITEDVAQQVESIILQVLAILGFSLAGYIVLAAALGVLTVFDVITEDVAQQVESIVLQVLAILGFSLAGVNTPRKDGLAPQGREQGMK